MKKLWAPWRMSYIRDMENDVHGCIFCVKPRQSTDRENLVLFRGELSYVILNLYPYNNGHLMVVPLRHCRDPGDIDTDTASEMWDLLMRSKWALTEAFHPEGFNIGMNVGRVAGAGIDQHLHMHIVPRWNGDTNFMPVLGETKTISQAIFETYDTLKPLLENRNP